MFGEREKDDDLDATEEGGSSGGVRNDAMGDELVTSMGLFLDGMVGFRGEDPKRVFLLKGCFEWTSIAMRVPVGGRLGEGDGATTGIRVTTGPQLSTGTRPCLKFRKHC